jgi:hypothetical protein
MLVVAFASPVLWSYCSSQGTDHPIEVKEWVPDEGCGPIVSQPFTLNAGPFILNDRAIGGVPVAIKG